MKKLLGIVVLGLLWCNAGFAGEREPGTDEKCLYVFERENVFERKFLPKAKERALGGVLVTYVGCNKYYDDWSWDYSTFPDIDIAHEKAYYGCKTTEIPKYNLTGCHLFSIDDVIVWGKDAAFITKLENDLTWLVRCIKGDCINGYGTKEWKDERKYVGRFNNGKANGYGTETFSTKGDRYEGEFKDGMRHGQGFVTNLTGYKYTGAWRWGKKNGEGVELFSDGTRIEGVYEDNIRIIDEVGNELDHGRYIKKYVYKNVAYSGMDRAFTSTDPTTFKKLTFKKKRNLRTTVPIGKHERGGVKLGPKNVKGFSYITEYEDNIKTEIIVETSKALKKMGKEVEMNVAEKKALYFANIFGQMPHFIKKVNRKIIVHKIDKKISSGGWVAWDKTNELHIVENPNCYKYFSDPYDDKCFNQDALIMLHELAHVVQKHTNTITPSKWVKAKNLDEKYCSKYAMKNDKEDFAESILCWVGVRYKSHKISQKNIKKTNFFIPNRIKFFDDLNLNVYPLK